MRKSILLMFALIAVFSQGRIFGAIVQNGSFENGLTGWTVVGGVATTTGTFAGIVPANLANQASLNNSGAAVSDTIIETALGLAAGRLDTLAGGAPPQATTGTAIFQTITGVLAGEVLTFNWTFLTNENLVNPSNQNDFAFWSITGVGTPGTILYRAANPLTPAPADFTFRSPTQTVTHVFTAAGDFTLGFGVMNVGDSAGASGLLIDNVAVPEPSAFAAIFAVAGAVLTQRRRRNR